MAALALEERGELEGKVVMVTGASSGLGLGFCLDLAKAGCKIIATARRVNRLQSLCHKINHLSSSSSSSSPRAVAVELDQGRRERGWGGGGGEVPPLNFKKFYQ